MMILNDCYASMWHHFAAGVGPLRVACGRRGAIEGAILNNGYMCVYVYYNVSGLFGALAGNAAQALIHVGKG
jgi:hypothetical protein